MIYNTNITTTSTKVTTYSNRNINDYDLIICFVKPSNYARGFCIIPRSIFTTTAYAGTTYIEGTFVSGTTTYWYDVIYNDNTHVTIKTNYSGATTFHMYGIKLNKV